jgi:NAD(P)-dependent dehydrogenase (short-subunit alcohol dehydrogenase family)
MSKQLNTLDTWRGIGAAIAKRFALSGARVAV